MEKKEFENYINAGKIWKIAAKKAEKIVKPGRKLLDIAVEMEKAINDIGKVEGIKQAKPAFPVNLSRNEEAAHSTPSENDESTLAETDVLKLDIGVQVDGYIADGAITFNFSNSFSKMIEANQKALENALSIIKPGAEIGKIGREIEQTLKKAGFVPVQNLSGHGLGKFEQHASPTIPNIDNRDSRKIEEGMAFAVEPFASTGKGTVHESGKAEIFSLKEAVPVRNEHARILLEHIAKNYLTMPFAERWIAQTKMSGFQRKIALRELLKAGILRAYPVLKEEAGKIVTQAEKTVVIFEEKVTIIN